MAGRLLPRVARSLATKSQLSSVRMDHHVAALTPALRDKAYPKLGNRDIVGYGWNGDPTYIDRQEFPCPAVRFRENSKEILALREKEKGDWHKLTVDEMKALYRASFRMTYAEMNAPTGEWKSIISLVLLGGAVTSWIYLFLKKFVLAPLPETITQEWKEAQLELMVKQRQGHVEGVSSRWDYENNRWK